ncbi:MAG: outer membrane protein assembly factor BamB family protein [Acidimicrobiia bacterium]
MTGGARGVLVFVLALGLGATGCESANVRVVLPAVVRDPANVACDWPMWGYSAARPFATSCATRVSPKTVSQLRLRWFFNTRDVVTATPAVVGDTLYVGDWSGRVYALRTGDGTPRWTFTAKPERLVYSGQIVASAAVADVRGVPTVFVPSGKTMYALRAVDGHELWHHALGRRGDANDPTEIESSPVVVDGKVIFGWDVHNSAKGYSAGLIALDARTGRERWKLVTAPSADTGAGCGDIWGSPSVDRARGLVIAGTGNCTDASKWGRFSDAMFAVDLETGALRWTYQPHASNRDDLDFAGAPNLIDLDGRALAGLGNKDGAYYLVDRTTGTHVATVTATQPGLTRPGGNFSTGGFIGPAAYSKGIVVGGTAVGPAPYLHGIDVATGTLAWQNQEPSATYAATSIAGNVAIVGGTDFTLRAVAVDSGRKLWSHPMKGAVSGGVAIGRDDVYAVAGIREPGLDKRSRSSGVYRFSLHGKAAKIRIRPPTPSSTVASSAPRACVGSPCSLEFTLKKPPAGLTPTAHLEITEHPFSLRVQADGLGPPAGWLRPGTPAASAGATKYAVFLSESDDNPTGGLVCVLDASFECTGNHIPRRGATYNRASIVAVKDAQTVPTLADGFERLVTTVSFDPPLQPTTSK